MKFDVTYSNLIRSSKTIAAVNVEGDDNWYHQDELFRELIKKHKQAIDKLKPGHAFLTISDRYDGDDDIKFVIHAKGPQNYANRIPDNELLVKTCEAIMSIVAKKTEITSISLPPISYQNMGIIASKHAQILISTILRTAPKHLKRVVFCIEDDYVALEYYRAIKWLVPETLDTDDFSLFLSKKLHPLVRDWFFLECYPDCTAEACPAYYIKTYDTEPEKRSLAINHYTEKFISLFKQCVEPSVDTVAMYIPSSTKGVFSNCGKVVSNVASQIPWLVDGTSSIIRTETISSAHTNNAVRKDIYRQENTLDITMDIKGKNIILFDDRCTSGNSARQVINLLYKLGAAKVWFIAFVLTDRRIFITEQKSNGKNSAPYAGRFGIDCQDYVFDLWLRTSQKGEKYLYGSVYKLGGPFKPVPGANIRIFKNNDIYFGYLTLDDKSYKIHLNKTNFGDRARFSGTISIISETSTEPVDDITESLNQIPGNK